MTDGFSLNIATSGVTFDDARNFTVAEMLRDIAELLEDDVSGGNIRDANGNTVGSFGFSS
jgi:hypothetical protein